MHKVVRLVGAVLAGAMLGLAPASAQLSDSIPSSSLTAAQQSELSGRLGVLQTRLAGLASQSQLREAAVRNIAIEIYGAQPSLDFESYAQLIARGARELRSHIDSASTRTDGDAELVALRQRAIAAAEDGQLSQARALYDDIIAHNRAARQARDRGDAADLSEAGRLAFAGADFLAAARYYGEAARISSDDVVAVREWRTRQVEALIERGRRFGEQAPLEEASRVIRRRLLPASPRARDAAGWADAQHWLGVALHQRGYFGDAASLNDGVLAFRAALAVRTRAADPVKWAETQHALAVALTVLGQRADPRREGPMLLSEAVTMLREVLDVRTAETAPEKWADTQVDLGAVLLSQGERGTQTPAGDPSLYHDALTALRRALEVRTRESDPVAWAIAQASASNVLQRLGQTGDQVALSSSIQGYELAQQVLTREAAPAMWGALQFNLALAHRVAVQQGDRSHLEPARAAMSAALEALEATGHSNAGAARDYLAELNRMR